MFAKFCPKSACTQKHLTQASARVVEGKLILSLPEAIKPVIWQMDLAQAKASALEVSENADGAGYRLMLKTPRGESVEIAGFTARDSAMKGLMAAGSALENAQGHIRVGTPANDGVFQPAQPSYTAQKSSHGRWIGIVLGGLLLVILGLLWTTPRPSSLESQPTNAAQSSTNPQDSSGVPVSADDFLQQKQ